MKTLKKAATLSLTFVCVLLVTLFTITACDDGTNGPFVTPDFTVSYDVGAGSGTPPASQTVAQGETIYLPGQINMTAPSGQTFNGWRTSGQNYIAGESFIVTGNTIFLAQWTSTSPEGFTVSYNVGTGSGIPPSSQTVASGKIISLPAQGTMTAPSNQTFKGWRTNGQDYTTGDSFTVTGHTAFSAQWTAEGPGASIVPMSVQALLNEAITQQESASSAEFHSANYDPDLKYIVLTYKVGTIKNMFLQYLSKAVVAQAGREFTYTEIVGHSETMQTENINSTAVNFNGTLWAAGAGAFAGASVFDGLGSLSGLGPQAKANAYAAAGAVAGKVSFDFESVTITRYTTTYTNYLVVANSFKQDMSIYPSGKKYAVASFADVGIYQILKYDPQTKTATAIPGKSLWFNVESLPYWDMYEYSSEKELSIPQQLEPFKQVNVEVKEADLYKELKKSYSETRSINGNWNINDIGHSSKDETFTPDLLIPILKQFGYTKLRIDVSFDYNPDSIWGGNLRLQIADWNKTSELGRKEFGHISGWNRASFSQTVSIDATNSNTGQFMLLWSRVENDGLFVCHYAVGNRTITITALK
ncbi:MAG: hypothetical protein LBS97_07380 [Treponema sp.]|nr:hypothetical protein [Treponema sp.]